MNSELPTAPQPSSEGYNQPAPAFGWTSYAEQINGRFAMIGFVGLLILEILTGQGLLTWTGVL
ncbi:MAG: chlorophyll A-B binding protein [Kastovskya adunca ATA6-11-RM4]|jgi:hypothetical protein|nr:chlorophyll A-B binding protein [Kastovskya adunca ATA6-11-RM4]